MEILKTLESQKLTKEQLASMLFASLRDSLDVIVNSDIHSVEVTELYNEKYQRKVSDYNTEVMKSILVNIISFNNYYVSTKEIDNFLNIVEEEAQACEYLYNSIQSYVLGDKETLETLIEKSLTEKEINNLSIFQLILKDLYQIKSNPKYKEQARKIVVDKLKPLFEKQYKELEELKEKFGESICPVMKQIFEQCPDFMEIVK